MANIVLKATGKLGSNIKLFWKAHGATATFIGGMGGAVSSGVLGARGWVKAKALIDEKDKQIDEINSKIGTEFMVSDTEIRTYTQEDANKDLAKVRRQTAIGIAKAMGPAVILGGASAGLLTYSHLNLKGQVSALGAYATAIESQLSNYRLRVANKIGKEEEEMLYNGVHKETITETVTDPVTGETSVNVEEVLVKDMDVPVDGVFRFEFKKGCSEWRPVRDYNLNILSIAFNNLTDQLRAHDYIELRDIYNELGIPIEDRKACETIVGCVCKDIHDRVEYQVIEDPINPLAPEIVFTVKTDGLILNKIKQLRSN